MQEKLLEPTYRKVLWSEFENRQKSARGYSLRAYARDLNVQAPTLSNVLRGKRSLSFYSAVRVVDRLKLNNELKDSFIESVVSDKKRPKTQRSASLKKGILLHEAHHDEIVADPLYFAAFSFMNSDVPVKTTKSFASCFGITESKANSIIAKLCASKMLRFEGEQLVPTAQAFKSTDGLSSRAIRVSHQATLNNALKKLEEVPLEYRDYRSLKLPINKKEIPRLRKELKMFLDKFFKLTQLQSDKTDVYELSLQLFPLSMVGEVSND